MSRRQPRGLAPDLQGLPKPLLVQFGADCLSHALMVQEVELGFENRKEYRDAAKLAYEEAATGAVSLGRAKRLYDKINKLQGRYLEEHLENAERFMNRAARLLIYIVHPKVNPRRKITRDGAFEFFTGSLVIHLKNFVSSMHTLDESRADPSDMDNIKAQNKKWVNSGFQEQEWQREHLYCLINAWQIAGDRSGFLLQEGKHPTEQCAVRYFRSREDNPLPQDQTDRLYAMFAMECALRVKSFVVHKPSSMLRATTPKKYTPRTFPWQFSYTLDGIYNWIEGEQNVERLQRDYSVAKAAFEVEKVRTDRTRPPRFVLGAYGACITALEATLYAAGTPPLPGNKSAQERAERTAHVAANAIRRCVYEVMESKRNIDGFIARKEAEKRYLEELVWQKERFEFLSKSWVVCGERTPFLLREKECPGFEENTGSRMRHEEYYSPHRAVQLARTLNPATTRHKNAFQDARVSAEALRQELVGQPLSLYLQFAADCVTRAIAHNNQHGPNTSKLPHQRTILAAGLVVAQKAARREASDKEIAAMGPLLATDAKQDVWVGGKKFNYPHKWARLALSDALSAAYMPTQAAIKAEASAQKSRNYFGSYAEHQVPTGDMRQELRAFDEASNKEFEWQTAHLACLKEAWAIGGERSAFLLQDGLHPIQCEGSEVVAAENKARRRHPKVRRKNPQGMICESERPEDVGQWVSYETEQDKKVRGMREYQEYLQGRQINPLSRKGGQALYGDLKGSLENQPESLLLLFVADCLDRANRRMAEEAGVENPHAQHRRMRTLTRSITEGVRLLRALAGGENTEAEIRDFHHGIRDMWYGSTAGHVGFANLYRAWEHASRIVLFFRQPFESIAPFVKHSCHFSRLAASRSPIQGKFNGKRYDAELAWQEQHLACLKEAWAIGGNRSGWMLPQGKHPTHTCEVGRSPNPMNARLRLIHPKHVVVRLEKLEDKWREALRKTEEAYAKGNFERAEKWDAKADALAEQLEAEAEMLDVGEIATSPQDWSALQEAFANLWEQAIQIRNSGRTGTFDPNDLPMMLRSRAKDLGSFKGASDKMLIEAAADAFVAKSRRIEAYKRRAGESPRPQTRVRRYLKMFGK